ncbi:acyl-CoA N-acyltransferase [Xylogone sp. PMI_703]|nr:acyl-CoA N-acyltransferase [Xylogone sp. PMI_703]
MAEESVAGNVASKPEAVEEVRNENEAGASNTTQVESDDEEEHNDTAEAGNAPTSSSAAKKKKSKKKRAKADTASSNDATTKPGDNSNTAGNLTSAQVQQLLTLDPAIAQHFGKGGSTSSAVEALKKLKLEDVMASLASSGRNVKEMDAYKFWQTQPVPRLGEKTEHIEEGPFKIIDPDKVPKEPGPLLEGFEWVTMDMTDKDQIKEVYDLLAAHYVEDKEEMFRFNYSQAFLKWALLAPGWTKEWHVGVRASTSKKLVAFISGVPIDLRVRNKVLKSTEINFLCVHRKLRSKRLTPVLIKEITRRCYLVGVYQAIYTAGIVLPTPVSTCRYFHRSINWQKLYEVGFSPLPKGSKPQFQVRKYHLPDNTALKGLRPMEAKDIDIVLESLRRYLARFDMAPEWTREEIEHWLIHKKDSPDDQVIWSYVIEDPSTKKITDFFSFYCLESSVIHSTKYDSIRAAYLYYYFTDVAFQPDFEKEALKNRLNTMMNDALILAKKLKFDVFNCVSIMDNSLFVNQQKFGAGDGQLHYYLYNYNANPIAGGVDPNNQVDENNCSGVGITML